MPVNVDLESSSPEEFEFSEASSYFLKPCESQVSFSKFSTASSTTNIFKDRDVFLQNSVQRCSGVLLEGPRRFFRLCLFGLIFPVLLISIPLYVRLILYPPFHFMMAPTDQRLLQQTSSSIWCQGQTVNMNGSFNAYLLPERPRLRRQYSNHIMLQRVTLKDDVKEYWGFFLQRGSIVSISLCTRYDGGMLMIMRGVNNLKKCAWIGEEDSAEQDEDHKDTSNESGQGPEVSHEYPMAPGEILMEIERTPTTSDKRLRSKELVNLTSEERREELEYYIKKVLKLSKSKKEIIQGIKKHKKTRKYQKERQQIALEEEIANSLNSNRNHSEARRKWRQRRKRRGTKYDLIARLKRDLEYNEESNVEQGVFDQQELRKKVYMEVENSSYEVSNATKELYLSLFKLPRNLKYERGNFSQSFFHDTSNEEHRSSFSSSEEALTKCDGLIGVMPLYPSRKCSSFNDSHVNKVRYRIPVTGTYYFVFSSDNEVFNSEMFFNMTLQRVVFDTDEALDRCENRSDCSLAFSFWSHDQAVVEVPEGDWNSAYTLEIKCQPRVAIYLLFLFLIPIAILFCAFY